MSKVLGVAPRAYYAWERRQIPRMPRRNAELISVAEPMFAQFRGRYRAPRILGELAKRGIQVSRRHVAHLMREAPARGQAAPQAQGVRCRRWPSACGIPRPA
jgi:hypothetical protein